MVRALVLAVVASVACVLAVLRYVAHRAAKSAPTSAAPALGSTPPAPASDELPAPEIVPTE
jgi:hypothetical protein